MKPAEAKRFNELYQRHLELLKIQGKSRKTIDAYSLAVRLAISIVFIPSFRLPQKQSKDMALTV